MTDRTTHDGIDDPQRGFAPLLGVILMVAITVLLAAILGTFAITLSEQGSQVGPIASLSVGDAAHNYDPTANSETLFEIHHQAGEQVAVYDVRVTIRRSGTSELVLTWTGWSGIDTAHTKGTASDWRLEFNGKDITNGTSTTMTVGDVIVVSVDADAIGGSSELPDSEMYIVTIADGKTSKPIARTAVGLR